MITEIPRETWRGLFKKATQMYKNAPWKIMGDQHVFGLIDPNTGQKCYGTVMGHMGNYYALALYRGKDGLKSMLMLLSEDDNSDPEDALYEQDCLMVAFDQESEADGEDVALMESTAKDLVDIDRIPSFRSYRRGMMPWAINETEAALTNLAIEACEQVAQQLQDDADFLTANEENKGKYRFLSLQDGNWESEWQTPDSIVDFTPPTLSLSEENAEALGSLPRSESFWLFERFFFRQPSMDEGIERPFFPVMFLLMDLQTQEVRGMDLARPHKLLEDGGTLLEELFLERGELPAALVVSNKENYILLRPLARALKMEVHLDEDLNVLPDIKAALYRQME